MKIYYAHAKAIYGSMREKLELYQLGIRYPNVEIVNPNGMFSGDDAWRRWMKEELPKMDIVVFTTHMGFIGRGVYEELEVAQRCNIPIRLMTADGDILDAFTLDEPDYDDWIHYCWIRRMADDEERRRVQPDDRKVIR